jgi:hypothetical protein
MPLGGEGTRPAARRAPSGDGRPGRAEAIPRGQAADRPEQAVELERHREGRVARSRSHASRSRSSGVAAEHIEMAAACSTATGAGAVTGSYRRRVWELPWRVSVYAPPWRSGGHNGVTR